MFKFLFFVFSFYFLNKSLIDLSIIQRFLILSFYSYFFYKLTCSYSSKIFDLRKNYNKKRYSHNIKVILKKKIYDPTYYYTVIHLQKNNQLIEAIKLGLHIQKLAEINPEYNFPVNWTKNILKYVCRAYRKLYKQKKKEKQINEAVSIVEKILLLGRATKTDVDFYFNNIQYLSKPIIKEYNDILIKCPKCKKNISRHSRICPFCSNNLLKITDLKLEYFDIYDKEFSKNFII